MSVTDSLVAAPLRRRSGRSSRQRWARLGLYFTLLVLAVPFVLPALWMLVTSLKTNDQVFAYPPTFLPKQWEWHNFAQVFQMQPFARQYFNSLYITAAATTGATITAALAGYALARLRFRGRSLLFILLMSSLFIPSEVTIIPLYRMVAAVGLVNTHWPLILVPIFSGGGVIATFLMRAAFLSIPRELEDAAKIDGLGIFGTFFHVALPVVRPAIGVVVILNALNSWNDFINPLIFLRDTKLFTIPLALTEFQTTAGEATWNVQMAATTLSVITIIAVFIVAQRQIIAGITAGSVKG